MLLIIGIVSSKEMLVEINTALANLDLASATLRQVMQVLATKTLTWLENNIVSCSGHADLLTTVHQELTMRVSKLVYSRAYRLHSIPFTTN